MLKKLLHTQALLFLATVCLGLLLTSETDSDIIRTLHRSTPVLATFVAILSTIYTFNEKRSSALKVTTIFVVVAALCAGIAGRLTQTSDDPDIAYNVMLACGILATLDSYVGVSLLKEFATNKKTKKKPTKKTAAKKTTKKTTKKKPAKKTKKKK